MQKTADKIIVYFLWWDGRESNPRPSGYINNCNSTKLDSNKPIKVFTNIKSDRYLPRCLIAKNK